MKAYRDAVANKIRSRTHRAGQDQDGRLHRRLRGQPGQRRGNRNLDRRLRHDGLRHRRDHGRARARRARLRVRAQVPSQDHRGGEAARERRARKRRACFAGQGTAINSGFLDGLPTAEAKAKMIDWLEEKGLGKRRVQYKLRDWLFSRQRYWGEPFPILWNGDDARAAGRKRAAAAPARAGRLHAQRRGPRAAFQGDRLAQPARRPRARDQHHAAMGRLVLVLPALLRSAQPGAHDRSRDREILDGRPRRRSLHRRRGARGAAPALRALLAQGALRPRRRLHARAVPQAGQPGHHPRRGQPQDVQVVRATSSIPTTSSRSTAPTRCASSRCSWARSSR